MTTAVPAPSTPTQSSTGTGQPRDPPTGRFQSPQDGKFTPKDSPDGKMYVSPEDAAAEKRIRLKLGDKEEEFDERTLAGLASRGRNAAQLMSRADKVRIDAERKAADAEAKLARLKDNPRAVLKELGIDVRGFSEAEILEAIEEEKERALPPEERAIRQRAREADSLKKQLDERQKSEKQAREDAETEQHKERFASLFVEAMKQTGLPPTSARAVMHRVASVYMAAANAGEEVQPEEAAAYAMEHLRSEQRAVIGGMSVLELADWLGPETMKKIRAHDLAEYRKSKSGGAAPPVAATAPAPSPKEVSNSRKGRWDFIEKQILQKG